MAGTKNKNKNKKNKANTTAPTTAPTMSDPAPGPASGPAPPPFAFGASIDSVPGSAPPSFSFDFGASSESASGPAPSESSFNFGSSRHPAFGPALPPFSFNFGASSLSVPGPAPPAVSFNFGGSSGSASGPAPAASSFSLGVPSELAPNSAPPTFSFGTSSESVHGSAPPPAFSFGTSSDVQNSSHGFSFAAPAVAPPLPPLYNLAPVVAPFQGILDFEGSTWKAKDVLGTQIRDLQGSLMSAVAERDTVKIEYDTVDKELKSAKKLITDLNAVIDNLTRPESDEKGSLSGGESSMASGPSNELEESYSYQDEATQTIENLEEAAKERKMDRRIADLETELKDVRRELDKAKIKKDNDDDYISLVEQQAADFEKKYHAEVVASAEWERQLDAEKLQVEKNATYIDDLEQKMQEIVDESQRARRDHERQVSVIADLKSRVEKAEAAAEWHKKESHAISVESAKVLEQEKKVEKGFVDQQNVIAKLKTDIHQSENLAPDLFRHQEILEDTLAQINKSIDEGPKFNAHPEAYVVPEGVIPAGQTLSEDLAGFSGIDSSGGESSSHESLESDADSDADSDSENTVKSLLDEGEDSENETVKFEKQITLEERLSQAQLLEVEVKVPVEEIIQISAASALVPLPQYADAGTGPDTGAGPVVPPTPTGPESPPYVQPTVPTPPLTPEVIIKEKTVYIDRPVEVDRFVFLAPPVHSWLHIERNFLFLLVALYVAITGTFFPWFIQQVRGTAPISTNPVRVPLPGEDEESGYEEPQNPAHMSQAQMMVAIPTTTLGSSPPTNGAAPGSDPSDAPLGSSATETVDLVDLVDLFSPILADPDTRESIPAGPLSAPSSGPNGSSSGNGNGDGAPPPGPPNGDGNGGPSGPPYPPNGDGNGGGAPPSPPAPIAAPRFWDILDDRPLPSIFWTLVFMSLHCLVYYFVYISFSTYIERNIWLGANNGTREFLHSIMGARYTTGILRKIFSESWARKIDRSLFLAVTKLGMELKTFPMPG
ncbi:hypothetical protein BKA61DRAFT_581009 [Leptodontidium sp. MPI-SDFR-AT-0119]|nr:hypothetical protein BKA61DRAFT_581009 [Leptodontidium sp. MPI-SDFR-AT-0119]